MFKKSKKFVITGLVAGAMIAGGSFAAADFVLGVQSQSKLASTLAGTVEGLKSSLDKATATIEGLTTGLSNSKKAHENDMRKAESAVATANKNITDLNTAVNNAAAAVSASTDEDAVASGAADASSTVSSKTGVTGNSDDTYTYGGMTDGVKVATTGTVAQ